MRETGGLIARPAAEIERRARFRPLRRNRRQQLPRIALGHRAVIGGRRRAKLNFSQNADRVGLQARIGEPPRLGIGGR